MNSRKNSNFEYLENRFALSHSWFNPLIFSFKKFDIKEDTPKHLDIKILDFSKKNLVVNLTVSDGALNVNNQTKVNVFSNYNKIIIKGPRDEINKALKSLTYSPPLDSNKSETLSISVSNGINTSICKSKINIKPINDPVKINTSNIIFLDKSYIKWDNTVFSDPDSKKIKVLLSAENSSISINQNNIELSVKNLDKKVQISGEISRVNELFSTYGKIKLSPIKTQDMKLTISVTDGFLESTETVIVTQKESVSMNATNSVEFRLKDKDPSVAKNIFSTADHVNSIYIRNSNCWAYDLDLTSISPWNSAGGNYLAGTLVSPRHIVYATHYQMPIGTKIRFIAKDNTVVERTLINKISPQYTGMYFPDITVGLLDMDVPNSIGFAKILPTNWQSYIDNAKMNIYNNPPGAKIPCLALDQEEKALVAGLFCLEPSGYALFDSSKRDFYNSFSENIIPGDSGNPAFIIINNQLVLITIWTFGGGGAGTFITNQKDSINQIMKNLGGEYQLSEIDLSDFSKVL